jgi:hypothetical protein
MCVCVCVCGTAIPVTCSNKFMSSENYVNCYSCVICIHVSEKSEFWPCLPQLMKDQKILLYQ